MPEGAPLKTFFLVISLSLLCSFPAYSREWRDVTPHDMVHLPRDLFFQKDYRVQWWYLTGHLFDPQGREFGYELTFFAAGIQQRKYRSQFGVDTIYVSHFAISDVQARKFYHSSKAEGRAYGFGGAASDRLKVWVDRDALEGAPEKMHITAEGAGRSIDLYLEPKKNAVLNGNNGYSRKSEESPLNASLYFSFTDLETEGTLKLGNSVFSVRGKSWFDREIFSRGLAGNQSGWDWFALQLDDGREIMLYDIRKKDGSIDRSSSGTYVERDGKWKHLAQEDFAIRVLRTYKSRISGTEYPSGWEITVPGEDLKLTVKPLIEDQEFTAAGLIRNPYWEGTCSIEGTATGRAYVELTGY